ncbi:peptidyl-prolyl cis-trans isomerase [Deltaproteobacteria bacterium]|nr:peptidyl-prolyl cis-trans isomerase [Deltaproteobacteria bacterium]
MKIAPGSVVSFEYTLYAPDGSIIDASQERPLTYLHGAGHIVPGLERHLVGKEVGDELEAIVPPDEGYGEATGRGFRVGREELPPGMEPQIGMPLGAQGPDGKTMTLFIVELDEESITVTPDHPLAGVTLRFAVAIRAIRAATEDELSHGHAHGHDGHDHSHGH